MQLIESFVRNPIKVSVAVLLVALFGIIAVFRMPKQLTPEVQTPTITIETRWPGASPQEVEREIIQEQEEQLKSVEGIRKLSSESMDSLGRITMEFLVGTNMDEVLLKVNSRLQQVREYPEDADQPVISTENAADRPIAWFMLGLRQPGKDELKDFTDKYPQHAEQIALVQKTQNAGLKALRLRNLAEKHPEFNELLPPVDRDVTELRRFAEDNIEAMFERVPGVSNSNVIGGLEDELQVIVDPQMLAARQLTISDVRNVLRGQNQDTSAGDFYEGKRRWVVRTLGQFKSPEEVENQLLAVRDGAPVYVRDVAEVREGFKKPDGLVRRFGTSSIAVNAMRETGSNVLEVMAGMQQTMKDLNEGILKQQGLELTQVYDETEYIYSSIGLVQENIFVGSALTMIVLMLFLHRSVKTLLISPFILISAIAAVYLSPWWFALSLALILVAGFWFARGALVVGLAIPTSIVGTFLILQLLGRTFNVISLAGLAFAVGMLVDNSIVVLENIYSHYERGASPFQAAVRATNEVWGAVVASTLTTVAVFLPVVFIEQEAGQLFRDIALSISAAVALSMIVAATVVPVAASRLFRKEDMQGTGETQPHAAHGTGENGSTNGKHAGENGHSAPLRNAAAVRSAPESQSRTARVARAILRPIDRFGNAFVATIVGINAWAQRSVLRRLAVVAALMLLSAACLALVPKAEYLPTGNRNLVFGILLPPPGYNLDQLMEMGEQVEADLRPYWDVDPATGTAPGKDFPAIADFFFVARGRQVFMGVRAVDGQRVGELVPLVMKVGSKLPGTFAVAKQSSLFEQGLTAGRTIEVEITGPDLEKLVAMGGRVLGSVVTPKLPDGSDNPAHIANAQVRPVPSLDLSSPEVHVDPKLIQAAELGVNTTDLGYTVNALVDGAYAGDYFLGGDKIDLTIRGRDQYASQTQDLQALPIATPLGQLVPLGAIADVRLGSGPEQINHRERLRAISIEVSPPPEMPLEDAMNKLRTYVVGPLLSDEQLVKDGYRITLAGTADKLSETWDALWTNLALALLITYLLMAALFESWLYPLVVITSVLPGALGGILGLRLLNLWVLQTLDVLTMLGFFILIGTVVNNAILIVHQSLNHMREDGMRPTPAILESVRTRIRPIFMTTTTTLLGLLPLVVIPGAGSELYRGLGSVVLGGLLVSTLFTMFLVPSLFSLTMDAKSFFVRMITGHETAELQASERHVQREPVEV